MLLKPKGLGCLKQLPDNRDLRYHVGANPDVDTTKVVVDLRCYDAPIWDQYSLNSCAPHAVAGAIAFIQKRDKTPGIRIPSRAFIYYETRKMEHTQTVNAGTVIRDNFKAVNSSGFCVEGEFPYDTNIWSLPPTEDVYRLAQLNNIVYHSVEQQFSAIRHVLCSGKPIVFGMVAYSSLFSEEVRTSGILTMPSETDTYEGGHAVMLVGYDLHAGTFLVRNSWGKEWGQDGYFTIPLHYVLDPSLAFDFWTVDSLQT